jgi:outer membrane protein insertion porin family
MRINLFLIIVLLTSLSIFGQSNPKRFELTSLEFQGNESISSSKLESVVASQESPNWLIKGINAVSSYGTGPIYFDSLLIDTDINNLQDYYKSNGFFETSITYNYTLDTADREAELTYIIEEDDPVYFRNFKLKNLEKIPELFQRNINDLITIDQSERYSDQLVQENLNNTLNYLRDHGYMLASNMPPVINIDTVENIADVTIQFQPGKRYKISDLRVVKRGLGKELVTDELIKNIVGIKPDSYYNYYALQQAQVRLYRTNLFSSATVNGIVQDTTGYHVPLRINTNIERMHELAPELILNNQDNALNVGVGLSFTKKNFLGDARKITLGTSITAQNITDLLQNVSVHDTSILGNADARIAMEQPFLFGRTINTRLEAYTTLQKRRAEYNSRVYGTKLTLDFELPRYTWVNSLVTYFNWENSRFIFREQYVKDAIKQFYSTRFQFSDQELQEIVDTAFAGIGEFDQRHINSILGFDIGVNKTDDLLFPTTGYNLSFTIEDGNSIPYLISEIAGYEEESPAYLKFLPIFNDPKSTLGFKLKGGIIQTYKGNKFDIPLNQRFYSGGSNSIRGWNNRELVPEFGANLPQNISLEDFEAILIRGVTPGGFFTLESSIEARNRLIGNIGSALFIDYGNTWNNYEEFRFEDIAVAAGFGFRYYSDFAPIRVDFGFKVYDPEKRRSFFGDFWEVFEWSLGIGEAF